MNGKQVPRFVWVGAVVMTALIFALVLAGAWLASVNATKDRNACERTVAVREDNRAMWAYLIERNPDSPNLPEFVIELNRRLPALRCVDDHPVPLEENT